jgi:hypothetical protein
MPDDRHFARAVLFPFHRAAAPLFAIASRFAADKFFARAFPPRLPISFAASFTGSTFLHRGMARMVGDRGAWRQCGSLKDMSHDECRASLVPRCGSYAYR